MNNQAIDETDLGILSCLLENSSLSHKEIGVRVHLTGQAVGARVKKLQEAGVIEGYTLRWNPERIGLAVHAFVIVFLKSASSHKPFQAFVAEAPDIEEAHRTSGEGCYWLRVRVRSQEELSLVLDRILQYGNYRVNLSLGRLK